LDSASAESFRRDVRVLSALLPLAAITAVVHMRRAIVAHA
jgi:hypothetical protein